MIQDASNDDAFRGDHLTWAVLLGKWMEFARSSVALPDTEQGRAMRASIADVIALQAVWFALEHLGALPDDQQALGRDRAEVLIDQHAAALHRQWDDVGMPRLMQELIDDARAQLAAASPPPPGGSGDESSSSPDQW